MNLTPNQMHVLKIIHRYRLKHGYAPTLREIAHAASRSVPTVFEQVLRLIEHGALSRRSNHPRTLSLTENGARLLARLEPEVTSEP